MANYPIDNRRKVRIRREDPPGALRAFSLATILSVTLLLVLLLVTSYCFGNQGVQFIRVYICIFAALMMFVVLHFFFSRKNRGRPTRTPTKAAYLVAVWVTSCLAAVLFLRNFSAWRSGIWDKFSPLESVLAVLLAAIATCALVTSRPVPKQNAEWAFIGATLFALIGYASYAYIANYLVNDELLHVFHHPTAVLQSVYNVAFDTPFTRESSGVYGHYAIFFWPILKLFGHTPQVIAAAFSFCYALVCLTVATGLYILVKKAQVLVVAALAMALIPVPIYGPYLQVMPLRYLWPLIILVYSIYCQKKNGFGWKQGIIGYVLCSLATVWNTDSGLVSTVAFTAYIWASNWQFNRVFSKRSFKVYLSTILGCVASVAGMVLIINIYNLMCGGQFILDLCFFPLVGGMGYVGDLQTALSESSDILQTLAPVFLFFICILIGLYPTMLVSSRPGNRGILPFAFVGIMGMGQSYYFLNRALAGIGCIFPYGILGAALLADMSTSNFYHGKRGVWHGLQRGISVAMSFVLCTCALAAVIQTPTEIVDRRSFQTMLSLEDLADAVEEQVPPDTYAFGYFTQEVYALLGWDPGYHLRDVASMQYDTKHVRETRDADALPMVSEITAQDSLLVSKRQMPIVNDDPDLLPAFGIPEKNPVFYYCTGGVEPPSGVDFASLPENSLLFYQARPYGISWDRETKSYQAGASAQVHLEASGIKENGLTVRVMVPGDAFLGVDGVEFDLHVNGISCRTYTVTPDMADTDVDIYISRGDLPPIPDNDRFDIEVLCTGYSEQDEDEDVYAVRYIGN